MSTQPANTSSTKMQDSSRNGGPQWQSVTVKLLDPNRWLLLFAYLQVACALAAFSINVYLAQSLRFDYALIGVSMGLSLAIVSFGRVAGEEPNFSTNTEPKRKDQHMHVVENKAKKIAVARWLVSPMFVDMPSFRRMQTLAENYLAAWDVERRTKNAIANNFMLCATLATLVTALMNIPGTHIRVLGSVSATLDLLAAILVIAYHFVDITQEREIHLRFALEEARVTNEGALDQAVRRLETAQQGEDRTGLMRQYATHINALRAAVDQNNTLMIDHAVDSLIKAHVSLTAEHATDPNEEVRGVLSRYATAINTVYEASTLRRGVNLADKINILGGPLSTEQTQSYKETYVYSMV